MAKVLVRATLRSNGTFAIAKKVREKLHLRTGDVLEFEAESGSDVLDVRELDPTKNPLLQLIGMVKGGREDGGWNHDTYLYKNGGE